MGCANVTIMKNSIKGLIIAGYGTTTDTITVCIHVRTVPYIVAWLIWSRA